MVSKHSLVLRVLAGAAILGAALSVWAAEKPQQLRIGQASIAELRNGRVTPLWSEAALVRFLENALAASRDPRVEGTLDSAKIERDGDRYFLVGRGRSATGSCLTPSIQLEPGYEAIQVTAAIHVIRIEACVGTTCPSTGCVTQRGEDGHITDCYCIPAGECNKVILIIPIPI